MPAALSNRGRGARSIARQNTPIPRRCSMPCRDRIPSASASRCCQAKFQASSIRCPAAPSPCAVHWWSIAAVRSGRCRGKSTPDISSPVIWHSGFEPSIYNDPPQQQETRKMPERSVTATSAKINPADHLPDYTRSAQVQGLLGHVDIWRDEWGIPHIRGASFQDAFAGLGFAHAQDRLWQMEALLRRGTGRYAEWLGARAVAGDIIARQMNGASASRRDFALLGGEAKAMLKSYARGVN